MTANTGLNTLRITPFLVRYYKTFNCFNEYMLQLEAITYSCLIMYIERYINQILKCRY